MTAATSLKTLGMIGWVACAVGGAQAATVISSHSSPDLVVTSVDTSTTGAAAAPWAVSEALSGSGQGYLPFQADQGSPVGPDNPLGTLHSYGKWISKTVKNDTSVAWTSFELELQAIF